MITKQEQHDLLISRGWGTWYNPNNWVHRKTVANPKQQDHTNYGMDLNSAYCFEMLNLPPFKVGGLSSMVQQGLENRQRIESLLATLEPC